jgi:hypothetical protein
MLDASRLQPHSYSIRCKNGITFQANGVRIEGTELGLNVDDAGNVNLTHIPSGYKIGKGWSDIGLALSYGVQVAKLMRHGDGGSKGPCWFDSSSIKGILEELENEILEKFECFGTNSRTPH